MESDQILEALKDIANHKHFTLWKKVSKDLERDVEVGGHYQRKLGQLAKRAVADSASTAPLVAQELSPDVIPVYVSKFPLWDLIEKRPANGLSHTYELETAISQNDEPSTFIAETGTVVDDTSTYDRMTTPIAVQGTRRGITLKAQAAGNAGGGPGIDLGDRELRAGLRKIARDGQITTCRYQTTISGSTAVTDPNGAYNKFAFNGLRYTLENLSLSENTIEIDITEAWTDQRVLRAVRQGVNQITDLGGEIDLLICTTAGSEAMFDDQMDLVRYVDNTRVDISPGRSVRVINTDAGPIPVLVVPGSSMGTWIDGDSNTFVDIIGISTETVFMPYLGNPLPSVLKIPVGVDGSLRDLVIPYVMYGLACEVPDYMFRVSLKIANG